MLWTGWEAVVYERNPVEKKVGESLVCTMVLPGSTGDSERVISPPSDDLTGSLMRYSDVEECRGFCWGVRTGGSKVRWRALVMSVGLLGRVPVNDVQVDPHMLWEDSCPQ